jgi:predicted metal-dependent phosphoesterase TrpH
LLIDLHTHTFPNSDDSFMSPDDLVEASKAVGDLDGICITEHDYFWDSFDVRALSRRHDFLVLPGCEVNTDAGHVLVFGLEKYVFRMHKVPFLRQLVKEAGGAIVAAHPYRRRYLREHAHKPDEYRSMVDGACADQLFSSCDAIEVLNGRATDGETTFALDLGRSLGLGMAGGSDSHRLAHLGNVATRFHSRIACLDDLIREIKSGRFEPVVLGKGQQATGRASTPFSQQGDVNE